MSLKRFLTIPDLFRPKLYKTRMKFQVTNGEVLASMDVAHVTICMYGYTFNLTIYVCDMGDLDCIFELDTGTVAGFITCHRTGRLWFNANQNDKPKQLSRSNCNASCHL